MAYLRFILATYAIAATGSPLEGVHLQAELTYNLPEPYTGDIRGNFIDTTTSSQAINQILSDAANATYVAYHEEFMEILGKNATIEEVPESRRENYYAYEGAIWVHDHNEVWFTGDSSTERPVELHKLDLGTLEITKPDLQIPQGQSVNGGYYYNGKVWLGATGNESLGLPPSIMSIDPVTLDTRTAINSYFGVPFNSIDDLTWAPPQKGKTASCGNGNESTMFFTTVDFRAYSNPGFETAVLPNAVYRYSELQKSVQAVISRADLLEPNGIAVRGNHLYVSDTAGLTTGLGAGNGSSGSPAIYRFDLDKDCNPVNKVMFALSRSGIPDGLHVDDYGRVWSAEYDGIVVRDAAGRQIGVFNAKVLIDTPDAFLANFALAGDKLVVLAVDRIFVIQLGQTVFSSDRLQGRER